MKARISRIVPGDSPVLVWEGELIDAGDCQFRIPDDVELSPHINYGWEIGWELPPFRGQRPSVSFHIEEARAFEMRHLIQSLWDVLWSFLWFKVAVGLAIFFAAWVFAFILLEVMN